MIQNSNSEHSINTTKHTAQRILMKIQYGMHAVGVKVAKDFGEDGLFFGEVTEFDDEDDEEGDDVEGGGCT